MLAWSLLEQGKSSEAKAALPDMSTSTDATPLHRARDAMLRGWLADVDDDAAAATALLDQAETHLSDVPEDHYMRRDLARYRDTRTPGGPGGTMLRMLDRG